MIYIFITVQCLHSHITYVHIHIYQHIWIKYCDIQNWISYMLCNILLSTVYSDKYKYIYKSIYIYIYIYNIIDIVTGYRLESVHVCLCVCIVSQPNHQSLISLYCFLTTMASSYDWNHTSVLWRADLTQTE